MIVTKTRILWLPESDSHEAIIEAYKLNDKSACPDFVRIEIVPPGNNYSLPLDKWVYEVDQDTLPDWYDAREAEIAVRTELLAWYKEHVVNDGEYTQSGGFKIYIGAAISIVNDGKAMFYGNSTGTVNGGETWFHDNSTGTVNGGEATFRDNSIGTVNGGKAWLSNASNGTINNGEAWFCDNSTGTVNGGKATFCNNSTGTVNGGKAWFLGNSISAVNGGKVQLYNKR
jgi:hypothetical protein